VSATEQAAALELHSILVKKGLPQAIIQDYKNGKLIYINGPGTQQVGKCAGS
jgi:hypothetical protein